MYVFQLVEHDDIAYLFRVHVLDETSFGPAQHLHQAMLGRDEVIVIGMQDQGVLFNKSFIVFNCSF